MQTSTATRAARLPVRAAIVLIRGAAGLGKSTLPAEAEAMARRRGVRVYHGASAVAGQSLPLGPVLEALMDTDDPPVDAAVPPGRIT